MVRCAKVFSKWKNQHAAYNSNSCDVVSKEILIQIILSRQFFPSIKCQSQWYEWHVDTVSISSSRSVPELLSFLTQNLYKPTRKWNCKDEIIFLGKFCVSFSPSFTIFRRRRSRHSCVDLSRHVGISNYRIYTLYLEHWTLMCIYIYN